MIFQGIPEYQVSKWDSARERSHEDVSIWRSIVGVESLETQFERAGPRPKSCLAVTEVGGVEIDPTEA